MPPLFFLVEVIVVPPHNTDSVITLGYQLEIYGKTLLLKRPHALDMGNGKLSSH